MSDVRRADDDVVPAFVGEGYAVRPASISELMDT
jgi:hypothetical protein